MKEKGWTKRSVEKVPFRREAAKFADRFVRLQREEFERLGVFGDWQHPYLTMDPAYEGAIVDVFCRILRDGRIYRERKPVYWCPSCETALADAEVEYDEKTSPSVVVKFPVRQWPAGAEAQAFGRIAGLRRVSVLVWTTTPWTLPANVALAFHPEDEYRLLSAKSSGERFVVGTPGVELLTGVAGEVEELARIPGLFLEGLLAGNPLNGEDSQGVLADFVSKDEGTGVVHIAPGHGQEDYGVGRSYGLQVVSPVDAGGKFDATVRPASLAGQHVWKANDVIVDMLAKSGHLVQHRPHKHSYPHCWRCKGALMFRATPQWFMRVDDGFRAELLDQAATVRWVPGYGKDRMDGMLRSRPDWCVSRQRYWGTPVPIIACETCGEPVMDERAHAAVVAMINAHGSDAWFERSTQDILPAGTTCPNGHSGHFRKEDDILDVWFDSGVSWAAVLEKRLGIENREGVSYLEGSDQHRGWFQTSLLPSVALRGEPPYEDVLTHGFVVDGEGRKMSKSMGNVIAPQDVVGRLGADVLRLWVAMSDYREDVRLSPKILDQAADTYRKIRNTFRFILGNLWDFDPAKNAVAIENMEPLDAAALRHVTDVLSQVEAHYKAYEFHLVASKIGNDLCVNALSGCYFDVLKDILYCDSKDAPRRRSAQTALWRIGSDLARVLAPVLSFTCEEVWQEMKSAGLVKEDSVFLSPVQQAGRALPPSEAPFSLDELLDLKRRLNASLEVLRQKAVLKGGTDALAMFKGRWPSAYQEWPAPRWATALGVSAVAFLPSQDEPALDAEKAPGVKCARCWITRDDVGRHAPADVCGRCADALAHAEPAPSA